jgi:hypothetical protein
VQNPFRFGKIVTGEFFTCRQQEQNLIKNHIVNHNMCWLYSERRIGKTSLIKTIIEHNKEFKIIYFDFFLALNKDDFIKKYSKAIVDVLFEIKTNIPETVKELKKYFKHIYPEVSQNNEIINISFSFEKSKLEECLQEVLNIPQKFAENNKKETVAVVFDEFQNIYETDETMIKQLRAYIQNHNLTSYIFLGSNKDKIDSIFNDSNSPFFESASKVTIEQIKTEEWRLYIINKFTQTNLSIPQKILNSILELSQGHPFYTQYFSARAWDLIYLKDPEISINSFYFADDLMKQEESFFRELFDGMTKNQKKTLLLIAKDNGDNVYGTANLEKFEISKSSAERCITSFVQMNLISKNRNLYYFRNPLLKYWIQKRLIN